jgi:hypothetical protein
VSAVGLVRRRLAHARERRRWAALRRPGERDVTPAVGTHGAPASWRRAAEDAPVALTRPGFEDAQWSFLFQDDTAYAVPDAPDPGAVAAAALRMRGGDPPAVVHGPVMKPPVWTWEVPLYFWFGGIASGAAFASLACDLSGDHRSAVWARRVALGALVPSPVLLVADLGRPERFVNMLRVFKPRSPMNMGAWALTLFGAIATAAVGADVLGRRRTARVVGGANAVVGGYLGSYAGVLLSTTAVPVWARSHLFLGPIFVATATATGAAATRFVLAAAGLPDPHPTRLALERAESGAIVAESILAEVNRRRLGRLAEGLEQGRPGRFFKAAQTLVAAGLATRAVRRGQWREPARYAGSACFLIAGLCFRYGWMTAGPPSARDDEAVARMARGRALRREPGGAMGAVRPG